MGERGQAIQKTYGLAVRAIITDGQRRCLLVRRSKVCRSHAGTWEWPGGKVDSGEDVIAALCREIREEAGLEIELGDVAGAYGFELPKVKVATLCLEARIVGGTVCLSEEHDDFAWVPLETMQQWDLTPSMRAFALSYAANNRSGGA